MSGRIAVLLADRFKTATNVRKTKETPVFSIGVHIGEGYFYYGELCVFMLVRIFLPGGRVGVVVVDPRKK